MTVLINPGVRTLLWLADPPKFYEVQLDDNGDFVLDADRAHVRTGNVIKGMNARKLMEELQRVRRTYRDPQDGHLIEVRGSLPKNWILDEYWEFGFKYKRDFQGQIVGQREGDQRRDPVLVPKNQAGSIKRGRRHQIEMNSRGVLKQDLLDIRLLTWWKQRYPDIPWRPITNDYWFTIDTLFRQDVPRGDAETLLLSCPGEFLDITNGDHLPSPERPIILSRG
jgi:hypothetical protein